MGTHAKSSLYLVSLDLVGQKVIFFCFILPVCRKWICIFSSVCLCCVPEEFFSRNYTGKWFSGLFVCFFFSLVRIWYRSRCKTSFSRLYIMSAVVILVRRQHAQNREIVPRLSANLRTFFDNCCWCPVGQSCYKNRKLYFALNFAFRFGFSPYIYPVLSCDCRVWLPKSTNKGRFVDDGLVSLFPPPGGKEVLPHMAYTVIFRWTGYGVWPVLNKVYNCSRVSPNSKQGIACTIDLICLMKFVCTPSTQTQWR